MPYAEMEKTFSPRSCDSGFPKRGWSWLVTFTINLRPLSHCSVEVGSTLLLLFFFLFCRLRAVEGLSVLNTFMLSLCFENNNGIKVGAFGLVKKKKKEVGHFGIYMKLGGGCEGSARNGDGAVLRAARLKIQRFRSHLHRVASKRSLPRM